MRNTILFDCSKSQEVQFTKANKRKTEREERESFRCTTSTFVLEIVWVIVFIQGVLPYSLSIRIIYTVHILLYLSISHIRKISMCFIVLCVYNIVVVYHLYNYKENTNCESQWAFGNGPGSFDLIRFNFFCLMIVFFKIKFIF